jgi:hypothetical protein
MVSSSGPAQTAHELPTTHLSTRVSVLCSKAARIFWSRTDSAATCNDGARRGLLARAAAADRGAKSQPLTERTVMIVTSIGIP